MTKGGSRASFPFYLNGPGCSFGVKGSKGNIYRVVFCDKGRSCACMDYRLRRRDCKHIRLVAQQLGVELGSGNEWHQVCHLNSAKCRSNPGQTEFTAADSAKHTLWSIRKAAWAGG